MIQASPRGTPATTSARQQGDRHHPPVCGACHFGELQRRGREGRREAGCEVGRVAGWDRVSLGHGEASAGAGAGMPGFVPVAAVAVAAAVAVVAVAVVVVVAAAAEKEMHAPPGADCALAIRDQNR